MAKTFNFTAVLIKGPFNGMYAEFPFDSRKEFDTNKHVWCKVSIGGLSYLMNLLPNGIGGHWLHLKKEILAAIGKNEGDSVNIQLEKNDSPRNVEVPEYLQWLLDNDLQTTKYFKKMPISGKKFWINFIQEPKNDNTKVERINRFFEYLHKHYASKN
jgi:hypothetical protein